MGVVAVNLPEYTTPDELAIHLGWSARKLKATARALGACQIDWPATGKRCGERFSACSWLAHVSALIGE